MSMVYNTSLTDTSTVVDAITNTNTSCACNGVLFISQNVGALFMLFSFFSLVYVMAFLFFFMCLRCFVNALKPNTKSPKEMNGASGSKKSKKQTNSSMSMNHLQQQESITYTIDNAPSDADEDDQCNSNNTVGFDEDNNPDMDEFNDRHRVTKKVNKTMRQKQQAVNNNKKQQKTAKGGRDAHSVDKESRYPSIQGKQYVSVSPPEQSRKADSALNNVGITLFTNGKLASDDVDDDMTQVDLNLGDSDGNAEEEVEK